MRFKLMILSLIFLSVSVEAVKPVEKEVYNSIKGKKVLFKTEGKQSVKVGEQNIE